MTTKVLKIALLAACGAAALTTASPANAASAPGPTAVLDPFEGVNRKLFGFHEFLDRILLRPAAIGYKRIMPRPIRTGLHNAISNLGEPAIAVNDILQGHGKKAAKTVARFASDTTFGVFGLFDVATRAGFPHHANDFGLTLARYGVKAGPYLFIPLVGPLTLRDAVGTAAGLGLNPLVYVRYPGAAAVGVTSVVAGGLDTRAAADNDLKTLQASSTDFYASFRSYYLQNREAQVTGGKLDIQALPDFDDPGTKPSPAPDASAVPAPPPQTPPPAQTPPAT